MLSYNFPLILGDLLFFDAMGRTNYWRCMQFSTMNKHSDNFQYLQRQSTVRAVCRNSQLPSNLDQSISVEGGLPGLRRTCEPPDLALTDNLQRKLYK